MFVVLFLFRCKMKVKELRLNFLLGGVMKNKFPGFVPKDEACIKEIWNSAIIVLDANVLLNIYRYSPDAKAELLDLFRKMKCRLWVPHRVLEEFFTNRLKVISDQIKLYNNSLAELRSFREKLDAKRSHPFVSPEVQEDLHASFEKLNGDLESGMKSYEKLLTDDGALAEIVDLFTDCVGDSPEAGELDGLISEGERRYENKTPPGYKDWVKDKVGGTLSEKISAYGDYIVWTQLLKGVEGLGRPVIFVTDDQKEDWWEIANGKLISARPELVQEFYSASGQDILFYTPERFLSRASVEFDVAEESSLAEETKQISRVNHVHSHSVNAGKIEEDLSESGRRGTINHEYLYPNGKVMKLRSKLDELYVKKSELQLEREKVRSEIIKNKFWRYNESLHGHGHSSSEEGKKHELELIVAKRRLSKLDVDLLDIENMIETVEMTISHHEVFFDD
ncbi:PIN-like domain-containing protein [Halomonas sp. V046]|uniref:PIN-like domain-containing protein n=1 Tax=Halomonas sp. V046 TaxID=3459611 RepID=UPI004043FF3F